MVPGKGVVVFAPLTRDTEKRCRKKNRSRRAPGRPCTREHDRLRGESPGTLHLFSLPHTPQHNAACEHGMREIKDESALDTRARVHDADDARSTARGHPAPRPPPPARHPRLAHRGRRRSSTPSLEPLHHPPGRLAPRHLRNPTGPARLKSRARPTPSHPRGYPRHARTLLCLSTKPKPSPLSAQTADRFSCGAQDAVNHRGDAALLPSRPLVHLLWHLRGWPRSMNVRRLRRSSFQPTAVGHNRTAKARYRAG